MDNEKEALSTLRDQLYIIFKHKWKIITIFLTLVLSITIGTYLMTPIYEASSQILVKFGRENVYMSVSPARESNTPIILDTQKEKRLNSEIEIIRGRHLIEKVIQDVGVKTIYPDIDEQSLISLSSLKEFIKKLFRGPSQKQEPDLVKIATIIFQKQLVVELVPDSDIINISFENEDPDIAAQVVNKLIAVFLEHHLTVYRQPQRYDFFDEQVNLLQQKLRDSEDTLRTFRALNNITSLQEQKTLLLKQISNLELELSKTRSEISEQGGKMQALMGYSSAEDLLEGKMGQETDFNPAAISAIRERLAALKLEEEKLLSKYKEESLSVINVRKEIIKAQGLLASEEKIYHDKAITTIGYTLDALRSKELTQEQHLANYQRELNKINSVEMEHKEFERQVVLNEENYLLYVKHMEEARISNAMDNQKIANISVVEPAIPPLRPDKPKKKLNTFLSIVLGGVFGLGAAYLSEYLSHSFSKPEDVQQYLGLPVLASIPEMK